MSSYNPHPGEVLKYDYLEAMNMSVYRFSMIVHIPQSHLSRIINAKSSITPAIALKLAKALKTTPEFWLNMQNHYDINASKKRLKKEIEQIIPIEIH